MLKWKEKSFNINLKKIFFFSYSGFIFKPQKGMRETKVYMGMEEVNIKGLQYCMIPTNYTTFGKQKAIDTEKDQWLSEGLEGRRNK